MRSSEARSSIKLLGRPRFFHNTSTAPPPRHNKKSVRIIFTSNPSITKTEWDLPLSPTHHKWIEVTLKNSSPVFCNAKYRGGVRRTEELKTSAATATNRVSNSPLPCPPVFEESHIKDCPSGASSAVPDGDRDDEPKSPITAAALLGSFFSLLRRMNKHK